MKMLTLLKVKFYSQKNNTDKEAMKKKHRKAEMLFQRGFNQYGAGNLEGCIAFYDKVLEIRPDKHQAWYSRGVALTALGKLEQALTSYDKALEIKPDYHKAWHSRGVVLYRLGRLEELIASYEKALDISEKQINRSRKLIKTLEIKPE